MIILKTATEIETMAEGGRRLAHILAVLKEEVRPGIRTHTLETRARALIAEAKSTPAFLGYHPSGARRPFPAALCVSVNAVVVHGVPSDYVIREGDLIKLDLGLVWKKFYVDSAITVPVGRVSREVQKLVDVARGALEEGIAAAVAGSPLRSIGSAINSYVRAEKFQVAQGLTGHGIGRELHEDPYVLNENKDQGEILEEGMVLAIEPMVVMGSGRVRSAEDDSFITADGSLAAHFEHTIALTKHGVRILTAIDQ